MLRVSTDATRLPSGLMYNSWHSTVKALYPANYGQLRGDPVQFCADRHPVILSQRKDFLEDYHKINGNFTHNLAVNYTESILRENDYILGRAAMYFARNDKVNQTINIDPTHGLQMLMHLQNLMPTVSSISGGHRRAPSARAGSAANGEG